MTCDVQNMKKKKKKKKRKKRERPPPPTPTPTPTPTPAPAPAPTPAPTPRFTRTRISACLKTLLGIIFMCKRHPDKEFCFLTLTLTSSFLGYFFSLVPWEA